jgi:Co/Zn/Cd efflux system component
MNLAYFVVEFIAAVSIRSVSLIADSADFFEDGAVNLLIFFAAAWTLKQRARVGTALTFFFLVPVIAAVWMIALKIINPERPQPLILALTAAGALVVNVIASALLLRHRNVHGSIARAAWLSARNDAIANLAIILAALLSLIIVTGWIDIVVGVGIAVLNLGAARQIWRASRAERLDANEAEA